jgi:hypothetical protein
MIVFAHAGHWLVQLLYIAPLLVFVVILARTQLQDRRERRAAEEAGEGTPT